MTTQEVKRKLTAILSADVKGYSRLMGADEETTVHILNAYKEMMSSLIQQHHGRVVDAPGDNVLAEFGSVVDAVRCGVEIQKELKTRNSELPENRRMEFRIGVNLGDVIEDGEQILGDGVNIAARMESLADGGGICISGTVYDHIENKLTLGYKYLGEQTVKNIVKPVRVYRVLMEPEAVGKMIGEKKAKPRQWQRAGIGLVIVLILIAAALAMWRLYVPPTPSVEIASKDKMAFPLPDKPSIAVLPFVNMSGDPKQEYFSDGITEDIITALSKLQSLFVIARNSTFTYKGKTVKAQQVAEELGVQYVLEGSVQKAGDRVKITAQLIDAIKGHHLWSERYDRDLKDIFALQNEITIKILTALQVKLVAGEQAILWVKGTSNLEAYEKYLQALEYHVLFSKEGEVAARQLVEEAIALDPHYAMAHALLAQIFLAEVRFGWTKTPAEAMERAEKLAQKAMALDPQTPVAYHAMGQIHLFRREHDEAVAWGERAVAVNPNSDSSNAFLAWFLTSSGRPQEAIPLLEKAIRRNPLPPGWYRSILGFAYRDSGRYEEAIVEFKKSLALSPEFVAPRLGLVSTYVLAGREEEARREVGELLRIDPKYSLERAMKTSFYKNQADIERFSNALRKAGLK
jgi:adenylate cyclase